jgi:phage tail-like protein
VAVYNSFLYGTKLYGSSGKVTYSVAPFKALAVGTVISNNATIPKVELTFATPSGDNIVGFRIVRNQTGISETSEDGYIVYEQFLDPVTSSINVTSSSSNPITDSSFSFPLISGKYAYYSVWILLSTTNSWYLIDTAAIVIPKAHDTVSSNGIVLRTSEQKFVEMLPRIYSNSDNDALGVSDPNSDLARFLSGFSYTLDEIYTYADLLTKTVSGVDVNPNFVPALAKQFGLPQLPATSLKAQKKLIRQAAYLRKAKGTAAGIEAFVSALTGYSTTVTASPNLLLSSQDSSFYKGIGSWIAGANAALTSVTSVAGYTSETYSINTVYTGQVVTSATNATVSLGNSSPKFTAVPVSAGTSYSFSFYVKGTTGTVTPTITWYDRLGIAVGTAATLAGRTVSSSWAKGSGTATAPDGAVYAGITLSFSAANTYYIDLVQLALSSVTSYHEADAVEIYLAPSKLNLVNHPTFKDGTGWYMQGISNTEYIPTTVPGIFDGTNMLHATTVSSASTGLTLSTYSSTIAVTGTYYTYSIYGKSNSPTTLSLRLTARDTSNNNTVISSNSTSINLTSNWQRFQVVLFVPTYSADVNLAGYVESSTKENRELYFDAPQLELGYSATDYFCGDYSYRGASWSGTNNYSASYAYPAKAAAMANLKNTINEFLPINSPYIVTTGYGGTTRVEMYGYSV